MIKFCSVVFTVTVKLRLLVINTSLSVSHDNKQRCLPAMSDGPMSDGPMSDGPMSDGPAQLCV